MTPTIGSHTLLLQMSTNLVHNAIVHNLPEQGTVWVTTSVHPKTVVLAVENTGEKLTPQLVSTLAEPFQRGTERIRTDHSGVGLGLAIVNSITQAHDGNLTLTPRAAGGLCVRVQLPAPHRTLADDDQGNTARPERDSQGLWTSASCGVTVSARAVCTYAMGDALTREDFGKERTHGHRRRTLTVDPEQRESYLAGCMSVVEKARPADGCLDFAITADLRPLFGNGGA